VLYIYLKDNVTNMPHRKSLALNWRRIKERYNVTANRCRTCGKIFLPPRMVCPGCRRKGKIETKKLSGKGEVYSYTTVHVPMEGFEYSAPYLIAIVKLEEGPMITGQITDAESGEIGIGTKVRSEFRKIVETGKSDIIHYGFKFVKDEY